MFAIIMGCGRVGARLANLLVEQGHDVLVLDVNSQAFWRLGPDFKGETMVGNGIDVDVLRRAGIERADAFAATTQGDNRNIMASQIARHIFKVPKVVTRIYDPIRQDTYAELGLETVSPTVLGAAALLEVITGGDDGKD
ncbi:MAG TPA: TrkA family potassium uptake protein [Chloroflexota bacterium]|jgi:trk system potassium uptake protein TrkA